MMDISVIKIEYEKILEQLGNPALISDWEKMEDMMRRKAKYEKIIAKQEELTDIKNKMEESKSILASREPELAALAEEELKTLKERETVLQVEIAELEKDEGGKEETGSIIVEVRAGVGGEEAALFAADLFAMYSKYAQLRGWKQKILDANQTELDGYKWIIFELSGKNAYKDMRYEGGVHRVQRIPTTEKSGRVHTSTCSVAVLPKAEKAQIKIRPDDLRVDLYRASGPGGQYVNRRETAVRITHLPTGFVVTSQTERSQMQNKENAMAILGAKLLERTQEEEEEKTGGARKAQIKRAKRSEKIRTYNFPQDRVTDHRVKKSWHNIEDILGGNLDTVIKSLKEAQFAE